MTDPSSWAFAGCMDVPYVRARFAQGHPEELINRLRSLATPSKQLINTLLRLLRDHAAINKRFAHDIAQAFAKLLNQLAHALAHAAGQLLRPCPTCWSIKYSLRKAFRQLPATLR